MFPLRSAVFVLILTLDGLPPTSTPVSRAQPDVLGAGYWHTSGVQLLDAAGHVVHINGVTWYGMESSRFVPSGLDFQRYTTIMDLVKLLGYNTIRLPISNELIERNPIITGEVAANLELRGRRALTVMDDIVQYAGRIGLKIILDDHHSHAPRPMKINTSYEPLWYTRRYPESAWIHDWRTLALRYDGNDTVIGFDLRNEPHPGGAGPWNLAAYLQRGPTWGPFHGIDNPATDWRLAAQRAGNAVLAVNPHLLIIVQGLAIYPRSSAPGGVSSSWWAGILSPVRRYPVRLQVPHQLVYAVHEWGPRKHQMPWFNHMTYHSLVSAWHRNWSFLLDHPAASYAAPVWLGEFGTCNDTAACSDSRQPGGQGTWFQSLLRYLRTHSALNWSFYALNGTNANNCATDNGLLNAQWNALASSSLQAGLRSLQSSPGLLPAAAAVPLIPGTATIRTARQATSPLCRLP